MNAYESDNDDPPEEAPTKLPDEGEQDPLDDEEMDDAHTESLLPTDPENGEAPDDDAALAEGQPSLDEDEASVDDVAGDVPQDQQEPGKPIEETPSTTPQVIAADSRQARPDRRKHEPNRSKV